MVAMINNNNNYRKGKTDTPAEDWHLSQVHSNSLDHAHKPQWHISLCGTGKPLILLLVWPNSVVAVAAKWLLLAAGTLLVASLFCPGLLQLHFPHFCRDNAVRHGKCVWSPLKIMPRELGPSTSPDKAVSEVFPIPQHCEQDSTEVWKRYNGQTFSFTLRTVNTVTFLLFKLITFTDLSKNNACTCTSKSS